MSDEDIEIERSVIVEGPIARVTTTLRARGVVRAFTMRVHIEPAPVTAEQLERSRRSTVPAPPEEEP